jgi:hypothetical protein
MTAIEAGVELVLAVAIEVKTPVSAVIRKTVMLLEDWLPTNRNFPVASVMMKDGAVPAAYGGAGDVVMAVGTPEFASIVNA